MPGGWSANLSRIVLADLDLRARYTDDEHEKQRIAKLRERWVAAMAEFNGAAETRDRKSVPVEDPA